MNAHLHAIEETRRRRFEADFAVRLEALFRSCPDLCGFSVQEEAALPGHVTCYVEDLGQAEAVLNEVAQMLISVSEEEPDAVELLKGRTFARSIH
jgi:hypothetical protein